uniref:Uncharacterized protein n=1 Tax=Glossina pallidipes TaxID=7398 RepID=A0A1A9ZW72_GLOPL
MAVFRISDMFRSYWMCWCHAKLSPLRNYTNRNGWNNDNKNYKMSMRIIPKLQENILCPMSPMWLRKSDVSFFGKQNLVSSMRLPTLQKKKTNTYKPIDDKDGQRKDSELTG